MENRRNKRFSKIETIKLVALYKDCECLWNIKNPNYKNKIKRRECYVYIQNKLNLKSIEEVIKRIKSMRDTFTSEKLKVKKGKIKSGDSYKSKLLWFDLAESFLKKSDEKINPLRTSIDDNSVILEKNEIQEEPHHENNIKEEEDDDCVCIEENVKVYNTSNTSDRLPEVSPLKQNKKMQNGSPNTRISKIRRLSDQQDEYFYFGQSIASQLRSMPEVWAALLQSEIQNIITKKKLELYSNDT